MDNVVVVNSADLKFSQFVDSIQPGIAPEYFGEQWLVKMNKLNEFIKENAAEDKITFSDDRLVLTAFKTLCKNIDIVATVREWWIVRRYIELYRGEKTIVGSTLYEFIDMHIGYAFSGAEKDSESEKKYLELAKILHENSIELGGDVSKMPKFVVNEISSKFKVPEITPELEREKWQEQLDLAEMMLDGDLTDEEMESWGEQFDLAEMMLAGL